MKGRRAQSRALVLSSVRLRAGMVNGGRMQCNISRSTETEGWTGLAVLSSSSESLNAPSGGFFTLPLSYARAHRHHKRTRLQSDARIVHVALVICPLPFCHRHSRANSCLERRPSRTSLHCSPLRIEVMLPPLRYRHAHRIRPP